MLARCILSVLIVVGIASRANAGANAERQCPTLPNGGGFVWQYSQGPDFAVCYAQKHQQSAQSQLIGVYIGFAPDFHPDPSLVKQHGAIEGVAVEWYKKQPSDSEFKVGVETLHRVGRATVHVWALAQDEQSLSDLIKVVEKLTFENAR